jgi:hypothetical protein
MAHCAIRCGRAYCSLRVVAGGRSRHHPSFIGHVSPGHNPNPRFAQLAEVVDLAEEEWGLKDPVDCWEDSDVLQWSLYANAARGQFNNPNDTENRIIRFLAKFRLDKIRSLDPAGFANYLCCLNSFMAPMDERVLAQRDKR